MTTKKTGQVGDQVKVADPVEVTRPDGYASTHAGGLLVLSQAGTWVVDGKDIEVAEGPALGDHAEPKA